MLRRVSWFTLVALAMACRLSPSFAQDKTDEIRQQIETLQRQLDAIENPPAPPKRNVTQIGASRTKKPQEPSGLVVRIYELNDLFAVAPPYAARIHSDLSPAAASIFGATDDFTGGQGGFGGGGFGGGVFSVRSGGAAATALAPALAAQAGNKANVKSSQDELMTVIRETISPDLWRADGKITKLGNAFVVSADEETHAQIEAMLNLFRERWGTLRTISVRAWWVSLSPAEARGLLDAPTEKTAQDGALVFGLVSDAKWKTILDAAEKPAGENAKRLAFQAALTAYNGQTVSTVSGVQSLAHTGIETVLTHTDNGEPKGDVGFNPQSSVIQEGLAFQVTPVANISGRTVLLDVHSRLALPAGETKADAGGERAAGRIMPADVTRTLDRRKLLVHRLSTTLRVPADRPYLVGGMSLATTEGDGPPLYLFVKVTVQELRNDREAPAAGKVPEEKEPGAEKAPPVDKAPAVPNKSDNKDDAKPQDDAKPE